MRILSFRAGCFFDVQAHGAACELASPPPPASKPSVNKCGWKRPRLQPLVNVMLLFHSAELTQPFHICIARASLPM